MGAPPCTPVLLTECRRRSPPSLPPPSRSRLSLPLRGSTLSGSEDPSWPPSPPSSRCGSPSRSMTSLAPALSTGSASKSEDWPIYSSWTVLVFAMNVLFLSLHDLFLFYFVNLNNYCPVLAMIKFNGNFHFLKYEIV